MKILPMEFRSEWQHIEYAFKHFRSRFGMPPEPVRILISLLTNDKHVKTILDLGCGNGRLISELAAQGYMTTGIDAEKRYTKRRMSPKMHFIQADIKKYPFEKKKYSAVVSSEVLQFFEKKDIKNIISRIKKATRKKGYVFISMITDLKCYFAQTKEEFKCEGKKELTSKDAEKILIKNFRRWNILFIGRFPFKAHWPMSKAKRTKPDYRWKGTYVVIITRHK